MSRILYDQYPLIVSVPKCEQSLTQRTLKEFLPTAVCPPGWRTENCFVNMSRQTGDPVLEHMPTGAIFSIADDREMCELERRRSAPQTVQISRPFTESMMNQDLVFTLGYQPPPGFSRDDFRGKAQWFNDGDDYRVGSFWKRGPHAGLQVNVNASGTAKLPFQVPASNSGFIVDVAKTFDYGADIRYPQAPRISRALQ